ncbi:hypothetical protein F2P81_015617 [Scophthalmus maximus]|uniref:Uncharacterized protein n=1 Tax=Scophthalmus maximus TaxID=52904 RepID=A0A6A4SL53_SCOMX|nr:hypothetical protein F2P81_015617 [Scophthalmus maximus]
MTEVTADLHLTEPECVREEHPGYTGLSRFCGSAVCQCCNYGRVAEVRIKILTIAFRERCDAADETIAAQPRGEQPRLDKVITAWLRRGGDADESRQGLWAARFTSPPPRGRSDHLSSERDLLAPRIGRKVLLGFTIFEPPFEHCHVPGGGRRRGIMTRTSPLLSPIAQRRGRDALALRNTMYSTVTRQHDGSLC